MIGFKKFLVAQYELDEGLVRKGAVALYAAQAKRNGDEAVRNYKLVKQAILARTKKDADQKLDALAQAMSSMADGMIATRMQIGSVSAQLTAYSSL